MADVSLPLDMTATGPIPTPISTINQVFLAKVSATVPDYTAQLPGTLIEDMSSTATGGLSLMESMRIDAVNAVAPGSASPFVVNQMGANSYGIEYNLPQNASTFVNVTTNTPGLIVPAGVLLTDTSGTQYQTQASGICDSTGIATGIFILATSPGTGAPPANTVTTITTPPPNGVTWSATNPLAGLPSQGTETQQAYASRVLLASQATAAGFTAYLRTQLGKVSGVVPRLVRVIQNAQGQWEILVGGGNPYQVAQAIAQSCFDFTNLVGATLFVTNITNANPGVVTTEFPHGLETGAQIELVNLTGMTGLGGELTITVLSPTTFSVGVNTTSSGTYVPGASVTPNPINQNITIIDYPDTYNVPFVTPRQQMVTVGLIWNTTDLNAVAESAVVQVGLPAIMGYINTLIAGSPINLFEMQNAFRDAFATIAPPSVLTRLVWAIEINGVAVTPTTGTALIPSDPEGYFTIGAANINIAQG